MRHHIGWIAILFLGALASAQSNKLKVYIAADMEGIGGVSTWEVQADTKGREYEKFRHLMTQEVNAAIAGAFDAGATEVLVSDSHGDAQNIDVEVLDKRVQLVRSWPRPLLQGGWSRELGGGAWFGESYESFTPLLTNTSPWRMASIARGSSPSHLRRL